MLLPFFGACLYKNPDSDVDAAVDHCNAVMMLMIIVLVMAMKILILWAWIEVPNIKVDLLAILQDIQRLS